MRSTKYVYHLHVPIDTSTILCFERSEKGLTKEALIKSITHQEMWVEEGIEDFSQETIKYSLKHLIDECEIYEVEEVT